MNEFRKETQYCFATAALDTCKVEGDRVLYQDRATSCAFWLWAIPGHERMTLKTDGALQEQHTQRRFSIPRQEGRCESCGKEHSFPPEFEPSSHAIIWYEGYDWAVEPDWECDSLNAVYGLETIRHVARRVAVR